ncbi:MAG: aldehyde ferredoxin oxidoreductase family protein [Desulfobacteraceae bacterium]|nr:aldehyde ferredoxin oxidoreductase family protein [Desulfobacteraceae bacterium]
MPENRVGGYNGKILRVNLTEGKVTSETIDESFCRKYIGGAGFIAHYLLKEIEKEIDPLGPENKLIFALGPLTGMPLPGAARHCIGSKSPVTGGISKSEVGEYWGAELRFAGFDGIILEGKSPKPVYLWVHNGEAVIKEANHLWGLNTKETQEAIRGEISKKRARIALIGPGGENLVRFACIMHGLEDAAGRSGMGAVMGSKNLKAIAVRGNQKPSMADPGGVKALRQWFMHNKQLTAGLSEFGTNPRIPHFSKIGNLPTRNFRDGAFENVENISAQTLRDTIRVGMEGCYGCPVRCKKVVEVKEPYQVDRAYGGPEYETIAALGSNCGVDDLKAISKGSELCNAYSLDTISTGCTIAFAMECFENGILTSEDTGGIDLRFGNADAMIQAIELIARREGIGEILAEGAARAAERIGKGAEEFAITVKKQEIPMHEPRLNKAGAVGYMTNPLGPDHCCNMLDIFFNDFCEKEEVTMPDAISFGMESTHFDDIGPKKVGLLKIQQMKRLLFDTLGLCIMLPYSYEQVANVTSAVTGWETSPVEQLRVAERIFTMFRLCNDRQGLKAEDDKLPKRFFQPTSKGALADKPLDPEDMEKARKYYYSIMGWDENGVPTPEKLEELGIEI